MGLLPEISRKGYVVREIRVVSRSGRRVAGFPADAFSRMTRGRFVSLPRRELTASIFAKIEGKIEVIFGDSVDRVEQMEGGVKVTLERGAVREFDLVVGADGLHSRVRELVFGGECRFEKYLGYKVATFEVNGYSPRDELVYVMYTRQQAVRRQRTRTNLSASYLTLSHAGQWLSNRVPRMFRALPIHAADRRLFLVRLLSFRPGRTATITGCN